MAAPLFVSSLRGEFICSGVFVLFYNLTFPLFDAMLGIVEAHSNGYNLFAFVTERFGISLFFKKMDMPNLSVTKEKRL